MDLKVKWGDTLSSLATKFGTTVQKLAQSNGISNPDQILAGSTLKIPGDNADSVRGAQRYGAYQGVSGADSSEGMDVGGPQLAVRRQGKLIGINISKQFDEMVAAAKADGVDLSITSGYRTRAEQEALWNENPDPNRVARPGTSNHEKGNAIDFGDTPGAWDWLKQNAGKFGFENYAAEPWHYSLDGH